MLLAVFREDLRYPLARPPYNGTVEIHELEAQGAGQQTAQGGLAATHVSDDGYGPVHASASLSCPCDTFAVSSGVSANIRHVVHAELFEERYCEQYRGHGVPFHRRTR